MRTSARPFRMSVTLTIAVVAILVLSMAVAFLGSAAATNGSTRGSSSSPASATPAPPASGTISVNPSVFVDVNTLTVPTGGTFGSGATVALCLSSSVSGPWSATLATVTLPAGQTTLGSPTQSLATFSGATMSSFLGVAASATGYVAATDTGGGCGAGGATYAGTASITIFSSAGVNPQLSISPGSVTPGSTPSVALGSGAFDPGATVTLYANYPGSSSVLGSYALTSAGEFAPDATVTIPSNLPQGPFAVIAQESSGPGGSILVGLTTGTTVTVGPSISVSPVVISGAAGSSLTITGLGFVGNSAIAANSITAGGVGTHHAAVTVSSSGGFTVALTLATSINPPGGPESVSITTAPASSASSFPSAFFVSNPNVGSLKFTISPSSLTPGESLAAEAWNFPAGAVITVLVGAVTVGSATATSLGFAALPSSTMLPGMPAGSYDAVAEDFAAGLYSTPVAVTVSSVTTALDPAGAALGGEYLPSGGTITLWSYGLTPATHYPFEDSVLSGSIGTAYENGHASLRVILGSFVAASGEFLPAANGTLAFSYSPLYSSVAVPPGTGTVSTVSINAHAVGSYRAIGTPTLSPSVFSAYAGGGSDTFTVSGLIPQGSLIYPGSPPISTYYKLFIAGSPITGTGTSTCLPESPTACFAPGGTLSITFTTPSATGVDAFAITYLGGSPSIAADVLAQVLIIISSPGATVGSGTLSVHTNPSTGALTAIGLGLLPGASVYDLNVSTSLGVVTVPVSVGGTTGAFVQSLAGYTTEPAGTYGLYLYIASGGSFATLISSYSVSASLVVTAPGNAEGGIGTPFTASATGLAASAYYDVYFGSIELETLRASVTGSATVASTVPTVAPGNYALSLDPTGTTFVSVLTFFTVADSATISLSTAGTDQSYAFPGELLTFVWTPADVPAFSAPLTVTVLLNGTAYTSALATLNPGGSISGSFTMPNACTGAVTSCVGTYWWVTLNWTQWVVTTGNSILTYYTEPFAGATYLQLVLGNGALLTGISPDQIAAITTAINQTLEVPLAELHASVLSINNATAEILTTFGFMNATLNSIDATVQTSATGIANVENGIVTIQTSLGTVTASLSALGGQITSMNGTLISVSTSLGTVSTTLSAVDATVTSTATSVAGLVGSVATITTSLGTISGQITSVQGGVATIQTQIGALQTNITNVQTSVSSANNSVQNALYWEIAAVVLLIVTLALTALLLGQARRRPPSSPPSGWSGPSSSSSAASPPPPP